MTIEITHVEQVPEIGSLKHNLKEVLLPSPEIMHQTGMNLINTRLWLHDLSHRYGHTVTLDTVPDKEWQQLFDKYDSFWFMGIYEPSQYSHDHALKWKHEYKEALPDLTDDDVVASPFAIPSYTPNPELVEDWDHWDIMVDKLHKHGKKVIVDFVPNHTAVDHPWATLHPEYFIQGTYSQFRSSPNDYVEIKDTTGNVHYLAHGKDPYSGVWTDTLQLNYANPDLHKAMGTILDTLANHADGVRCDMAMLLNPQTFLETWSDHLTQDQKKYVKNNPFWSHTIPFLKEKVKKEQDKDFIFIAEAYFDGVYGSKEILGKDFDFLYGSDYYKHIKDIVRHNKRNLPELLDHIRYIFDPYFYSSDRHHKYVVFTENHDEGRAVYEFGEAPSRAVAALTGFLPDTIFLLNQGQEEGRKIRPPMQIKRFPTEAPNPEMERFYSTLLELKRSKLFQQGTWRVVDTHDQQGNMVALQVTLPLSGVAKQSELCATICVNLDNLTSTCRINNISKKDEVQVLRPIQNDWVPNPDTSREGGMFVELLPWETQIIFSQHTSNH